MTTPPPDRDITRDTETDPRTTSGTDPSTHPGSSARTDPRAHAGVDWDAEEEAAEAAGPRDPQAVRRWWLVGGVAVLVMSLMAVVWGLSATVGRVHWSAAGHEVVSEEQVDVRLDVQRDPAREVTCRIEAQDAGHAVVGRTDVAIAPGQESRSRHVVSVRTASPAITGYVDECWYTDEGSGE